MESYKNTNQNLENESFEKFEKEDDFEFLSEEELSELTEDEKADYNRRLEQKAEVEQVEYHSKAPEIDPEKVDEKWKNKVEKLYKKDPEEPYWNK
jgi:hypothetical protein